MAVKWGGRGPGHMSRNTFPNSFTPLSLFSAGEQGFWYDPSDFSTLFQDTAGTVPVTAVGQSVARINDKSGRGNHATQSDASRRPILRQNGSLYYLEFDGTDDGMVTGTITPGVDKAQVFAGFLNGTATGIKFVYEYSATSDTNNGSFGCYINNVTVEHPLRGTAVGRLANTNSLNSGATMVTTELFDIAGAAIANEIRLRRNGASDAGMVTAAGPAGTGSFGDYPLYIGRRGGSSLPFNGHIYSLIGRFGPNLTTAQIEATERWVAQRTGVTL